MKTHFNFPGKLDIKIYMAFFGQSQVRTYRENRGEKYNTADVPILDDIQFMLGLCTAGMIFTRREMRSAKRIKGVCILVIFECMLWQQDDIAICGVWVIPI
ncbi:hypothetical protein D7V90_01800 [bacterium 1xD42-87]|nr:hypothetical protein D7V90_01800 [bacterium 1xD42-87]